MRRFIACLLITAFVIHLPVTNIAQSAKSYSCFSPDKKIQVNIISKNNSLFYSVQYKNKPVIKESALGIIFAGEERGFVNTLQVTGTVSNKFKETWKPVWGFNSSILNEYNSLLVKCTTAAGENMNIQVRVFNEGMAFRYEVARKKPVEQITDGPQRLYPVEIMGEATEFNIAENAKAFWQPLMKRFGEHFENRHKTTPVSEIDSCNTPVTMKFKNGTHISIHEAALINYTSTVLVNDDKTSRLRSFLVPWPDGMAVRLKEPVFNTPWRTIQISADAAGLINGAQMILNLNEPSKITNTSWIKPMKFVGVWWEMHLGLRSWKSGSVHGATTDNTKKHIDFAAANGIDAVLAEGWNTGWETFVGKETFSYTEPYPDFDLEYLAKYAKRKGVQLMSHHETGNNLPDYERQMEAAYAQMQNLGQHAVKTGYVGDSHVLGEDHWHQGQRFIQHLQQSTELSAKYQVCIDPHEVIKPTGLCRTWPNLMSGEGVRGNEWNAWSDGNLPEHETILPFTRGLAGPMDYTPGIFDVLYNEGKRRRKTGDAQYTEPLTTRVHTTLAKQLALYVVLYSPLQMAADLLENYENQKAFQFIRDVPVNFHETKVLAAEIGDYYAVARRNGNNWFIGAVTDENPRTLNLKLNFLKPGKKYKAIIYSDNTQTNYETNPAAYDVKEMDVTSASVISRNMIKSGGFAVSIFEK